MKVEETISAKLEAAFKPIELTIANDSARHAGHGHAQGKAGDGGESHFQVTIVSEKFAGVPRLQRHRMINEALAEELAGSVHALAIRASAPGEA
jgi:stress-induced morphogen